MTEPLPCPFCGHVGLSQSEGPTFRWLSTECNGCGAQCGEERINTMTMERGAAIEQAKEAAIKTWNTRASTQRKPLTIDEVEQILAQHNYEIHGDRARYIVRMTEEAHNIKEGT